MIHLGDITKINGAEIEKVDCIIGGSPCQDLSVAGKRAGLDGQRSGLFSEQIRVIKEMREDDRKNGRSDFDIRPRYGIWENVPGALSSPGNKNGEDMRGEDFRIVLEEFARISDKTVSIPMPKDRKWPTAGAIIGNGWSIAWCVKDLQFYGCPQRRRRIHLLVDFNGETAPYILLCDSVQPIGTSDNRCPKQTVMDSSTGCRSEISLKREGLSGDFEPCIAPWKGIATDPERCTGECNTLKIRGGVQRDRLGKTAGKGPLIQKDLSATIGVTQDQTLF